MNRKLTLVQQERDLMADWIITKCPSVKWELQKKNHFFKKNDPIIEYSS